MTFTHKPGSGALFRNDKKDGKEHRPDYKGQITLPDGSTLQLGGWISEGNNGKYLALRIGNVLPPQAAPDDA